MIVQDRTTWNRLFFSVKGSSLSRTWPRIAVVTGVAILVTYLNSWLGYKTYSLTTLPFTLIGVALGVFLGFRNNESYDRFWEGRRLWGQMVNVSRSFTRQIQTLVALPSTTAGRPSVDKSSEVGEFQLGTVGRLIAYVHAFRHHLRNSNVTDELTRYLTADEISRVSLHANRPLAILQLIAEQIQAAYQSGWIHVYHLPILEASLTEMTAIQGGCERIKATPIPFAYTVLIHRIVGVYCFMLPFGIVDSVGLMTPFVVLMIAHAFFGLDAIGDEIEEPFGLDPNDLPLSAITRMIEVNLLQLSGESDVPELLQAEDSILR